MALSSGPSGSGLVVLLLGEKHSGKSSTGNIILGRQAFGVNTKCSSKATSTVFGKEVTVVDTPGWQPHCPTSVSEQIRRGLSLCESEPTVIVLVMSVLSPFGPEQWGVMGAQLRRLQTPIWERAMLLFTNGDSLGHMPIQEHIRQQGRTLQWLLEQCGNRHHVLTNQLRISQSEARQLFVKMQRIADSSRSPVAERYRRVIRDVSGTPQWSRMGTQEQIEMKPMMKNFNLDVPRVRGGQGWSAAPTRLPRAVSLQRAVPKSPLSLVLLGRRKSGKSSVGNLILNRRQFKTDTKTPRCSVGQGAVSGCSVTVVDTPGWSLFGLSSPEEVKTEISQSPSLCLFASKMVFVLAVPVDSFKEKHRSAVEEYLSVLGENIWMKMLVLFTFGDELRGKTVEKHIEKQGRALQWLMQRCGYRHHVIDTNIRDNTQVLQLLEKIQRM